MMLKKKYLIITLPLILAILGSLLYNNIAVSKEEEEPKQVEVTNFPLDEEGNLKIAMSGKPLETYTDSVQITVFECDERFRIQYNPDVEGSDVNHPLELAFAFSSRPRFQDVTDLWISFEVTDYVIGDNYIVGYRLDLAFNNGTTNHIDVNLRSGAENHIITVHIVDEDIYSSIAPSINTLTLSNPEFYRPGVWRHFYFYIKKVIVFIEYEFQG